MPCSFSVKLEQVPKQYKNPKGEVVTKLNGRFKAMNDEALRRELERLKEAEDPAQRRKGAIHA